MGLTLTIKLAKSDHICGNLLDILHDEYCRDYFSIPAEPDKIFFRSQKVVYDHLNEPYFSYSGPTSMGKSFIMRMFIKEQILEGINANFAILVPTKALLNEVSSKIINDLTVKLAEHNYTVVTSVGAIALKQNHNFIFVLTPERMLYLLIDNPEMQIDCLFVDEAHKISSKDKRSAFYYKVIDMLSEKDKKPRIIFSSPNIPNPEVYLKLIPNAELIEEQKLATTFAPVSQVKYLIDVPNNNINLYNSYTNNFLFVSSLRNESFCDIVSYIGHSSQNIVYCNSTAKTVKLALEYAYKKTIQNDKRLFTLARDIRNEVHGDYYLANIITKGVAYHIGYLPSAIRMRIEDLFKEGIIKTIFCTSTLLEGVNLPADNLFITDFRNGTKKFKPVDFRNLIGRVGRLEYNLYGNVFLVRLEEKVKPDEIIDLLKEEIPLQKLSIVTELSKNQKKLIVENLLEGNIQLHKHPKKQTNDEYDLMRKFAIILLKDIIKGNNSIVKREFAEYLGSDAETKIRSLFNNFTNKLDDDINISIDQTNNLNIAISQGLSYPILDYTGNANYASLLIFLERLCKIFKWEIYEQKTLGHISLESGKHKKLGWYGVILLQWIKGTGLSHIMEEALNYKRINRKSGVEINGKILEYDDSIDHRNIVISDVLKVIDNVILFSLSNYFLKFLPLCNLNLFL